MHLSLSTHVLYLGEGRPASALGILLAGPDGRVMSRGETDADGRLAGWPGDPVLTPGVHRLEFLTGAWFSSRGERCFYPTVIIEVELERGGGHYHVPLLLNRFGYSTYRGS